MTKNKLSNELDVVEAEIAKLKQRRRDLYKLSLEATKEEDKICADWLAEMCAEEPIATGEPFVVRGLSFGKAELWNDPRKMAGRLAKVRPCAGAGEGRTLLGIAIGHIATSLGARPNRETGILHVSLSMHNPAFWLPAIGEIVYGAGSWWGLIKTPEQLREITDEDIESVWYVQALRALEQKEEAP